MRQIYFALISFLFVFSSKVFAYKVIGHIDKVSYSKGSYYIQGWACDMGVNKPIYVQVYYGAAGWSKGKYLKGDWAVRGNETAVNKACKTSSKKVAHRFHIPLTPHDVKRINGRKIYMHGVSKSKSPNYLLRNSGKFTVRVPKAPQRIKTIDMGFHQVWLQFFGLNDYRKKTHLDDRYTTKKVRQRLVNEAKSKGSRWIRTDVYRHPWNRQGAVDAIKDINKSGQKAMIALFQEDFDYTDRHKKNPLTGKLRFSKINVPKWKRNLESFLIDAKRKGLKIDAFEIGNELDWYDFNGDFSPNRVPYSWQIRLFFTRYAQVLKVSNEVISKYYPKSLIIGFGFSMCENFSNGKGCMDLNRTYRYLPGYLKSAVKSYVDGFAFHGYLWKGSTTSSAHKYVKDMGRLYQLFRKPIHVTEFGIANDVKNRDFLLDALLTSMKYTSTPIKTFMYSGSELPKGIPQSYINQWGPTQLKQNGKWDKAIRHFRRGYY